MRKSAALRSGGASRLVRDRAALRRGRRGRGDRRGGVAAGDPVVWTAGRLDGAGGVPGLGPHVDLMRERLVSAGTPVGEPVLHAWGHYSISVRDPVEVDVVLYADVTDG